MTKFSSLFLLALSLTILPQMASAQQKAKIANPTSSQQNWEGFYAGINGGYMMGWYQKADGTTDTGVNGGFGGVQFGYDWQVGQSVYGIVADYDLSTAYRDYDSYQASHSYIASIHSRIGQLIAPDALVYGLAGLSFSDTKDASGGDSDVKHGWGYTVGLGFEKFIAERTSLFTEYRYSHLNKVEFGGAFTGNSAICDGNEFRIGINFRF